MNTVIKGTKTIKEYKELKAWMEQKAEEFYNRHRKASGEWQEGDISKIWFDPDGNLCIEYASGKYWHYSDNGERW